MKLSDFTPLPVVTISDSKSTIQRKIKSKADEPIKLTYKRQYLVDVIMRHLKIVFKNTEFTTEIVDRQFVRIVAKVPFGTDKEEMTGRLIKIINTLSACSKVVGLTILPVVKYKVLTAINRYRTIKSKDGSVTQIAY